jgi:hypothetical protein
MLQKRRITSKLIQEMVILRNILPNSLIVGRDPQRILKSKKPQKNIGMQNEKGILKATADAIIQVREFLGKHMK